MIKLIDAILEYIKTNSIDFIAMIASIFIALETDRLINWKKEKRIRKEISKSILSELGSLKILLSKQTEQTQSQIDQGSLPLKLSPYDCPYWNSIQNTDRIEFFADNPGYSDTITFYSELEILNLWESMQTQYILFNNDSINAKRVLDLIKLISAQRNKCLNSLEKAVLKIEGGKNRWTELQAFWSIFKKRTQFLLKMH